jgi:hypothetical protein
MTQNRWLRDCASKKSAGTDQPRYVEYYHTGKIAPAKGISLAGSGGVPRSAPFRAHGALTLEQSFDFGFHLRSTPRQVYGWRELGRGKPSLTQGPEYHLYNVHLTYFRAILIDQSNRSRFSIL